MPRKASLEPKIGLHNVKQNNGDIYVYERTTLYNPKKQFNETQSSRLVGKIPAGKTEMIATRPHRAKNSAMESAFCKRIGVTDILDWIGRESGIDQDIIQSTDRATAEKTISIARYWCANPGKTIPFIEEWQISHIIPYTYGISQDGCYALMRAIGIDADMRQKFFCARAEHTPSKSSIAFDSTTVSSYSENQIEARYGYNKSGDGLKSVKLLTMYCLETGQPIAYARQPGNIPDVISIFNASAQLSVLGMEKPMLVMDAGFYFEGNMLELIHRHVKFLIMGKLNIAWVKSEFERVLDSLCQLSNNCPFDPSVYGVAVTIQHDFQWVRKRTRGGASKGDTVTETHRIYLYLYRNSAKAECERASISDDVRKVQEQLTLGVQLSADEQRIANKYLSTRNTRGGLSITYNEEAFQETTRFAGCFVLLSNTPLDIWDALQKYRRREKIEEHFRMDKQYVDGNRTRVWYPDSLNGRLFCQFVTLCYHEFLHRAISNLKKTLAVKNGHLAHDNATNLKEEKALLNWLNSMSIERLFAWFDCIEETTVNTNRGKIRWRTETIKRDQMFLSKLGVIKQ
jgi:transposase